jgi:hypothetical protein
MGLHSVTQSPLGRGSTEAAWEVGKKQQVPPLRSAPVGMTLLFQDWEFVTENSGGSKGALQIPRLRSG